MTELSPVTHLHADGDRDEPVRGVGRLLPSTRARLVDPDTGQDVAAGEPGEVWIHGPQVMKGYFGRPEDTDAMVDADDWLHTGDIARVVRVPPMCQVIGQKRVQPEGRRGLSVPPVSGTSGDKGIPVR